MQIALALLLSGFGLLLVWKGWKGLGWQDVYSQLGLKGGTAK